MNSVSSDPALLPLTVAPTRVDGLPSASTESTTEPFLALLTQVDAAGTPALPTAAPASPGPTVVQSTPVAPDNSKVVVPFPLVAEPVTPTAVYQNLPYGAPRSVRATSAESQSIARYETANLTWARPAAEATVGVTAVTSTRAEDTSAAEEKSLSTDVATTEKSEQTGVLQYVLVAGQWVLREPEVPQTPVASNGQDAARSAHPSTALAGNADSRVTVQTSATTPARTEPAAATDRAPAASADRSADAVAATKNSQTTFAESAGTSAAPAAAKAAPKIAASAAPVSAKSATGESPQPATLTTPQSTVSATPQPTAPAAAQSAAPTNSQPTAPATTTAIESKRGDAQAVGEATARANNVVTDTAQPDLAKRRATGGRDGLFSASVSSTRGAVSATLPNAQEKFAASAANRELNSALGVKAPDGRPEKTFVVVDKKGVTATPNDVGTSAANREAAMSFSARTPIPTAAEAQTLLAPATGGLQADRAVAPSTQISQAQAPEIVREIHAISDRIAAVERNSVEVRFEFSPDDTLSVRVEYRDGTVHTTFKTDSVDVRDAIAREWQVQAGAVESRSYKVAEPVFTASTSNGNDRELSSGGNGARQQAASDQQSFTMPTSRSVGAESSRSATPASAAPATRPDTSRLLHVFA